MKIASLNNFLINSRHDTDDNVSPSCLSCIYKCHFLIANFVVFNLL